MRPRFLSVLLASGVAAAAPNPWLESARVAYARLDCEKVLADLELAARVPTNDQPSQLAILDYSARCQVALGHRAEADEAFAKMIALDPRTELDPSLSPKILDAFRAAKLKLYPAQFVTFRELPAMQGLHRAELVDPWRRVSQVVLGTWDERAQKFVEQPLAPASGVFQAQVAGGLTWFLEARAASGEGVALLGKKVAPAPAPVPVAAAMPVAVAAEAPPPPEPPKVARWITVGAGAAVALAGIALLGVSATSRSSAERAVWANDAVAIGGRASAEGGWGGGLLFGGAAVITAGFIFTW